MKQTLIGVVGPCAAGKSTLISGLAAHGYNARHIAQEHSYVPDMWRRITKPDILIYLDVPYPQTVLRRRMDWTEAEYNEQLRRLEHSRRNADLVVDTGALSIEQVCGRVLAFLEESPYAGFTTLKIDK